MKPIDGFLHDRANHLELKVTARRCTISIRTLQEMTGARASHVRQFLVSPGKAEDEEEITIRFMRSSETSVDAIAETLRENPSVKDVKRSAA